jgi:hypothetical protein
MKKEELVEAVKNTHGKFFAVDFVKKDGSERHMICRTGVSKHLRGGNKTTGPNLITVFDVQKKQYRCFEPERVFGFKCGKVELGGN